MVYCPYANFEPRNANGEKGVPHYLRGQDAVDPAKRNLRFNPTKRAA
jgi:hypothetical protein